MTLVLRYSARSDRGLVRQNNQDSVYAGPRLLALADGMGGHAAGEVASKLVISALVPLDEDEPGDDLLAELHTATVEGNAAISNLITEQPDLEGMGTTLTAILFAGHRLGMVHIGDSRAYLMRDDHLSQITKDDTFVQSLVDEGRITPDEVHTHPQRSLLLRALTGHDIDPALTVREARAGDRYLLCSDGLSSVVSHETLEEALLIRDPKICSDRLIELALRGGGPDNVTVIVADVVDIDFGEDAPILGGAAGDGSEIDQAPPDSAAARAAVTTLPRVAPHRIEPRTPAAPPRRKGRTAIFVLTTLIVLAGAAVLARLWVMQQYYVGQNGDYLAIYQGVRGSVAGIPLQNLREGSCPPHSVDCQELKVTDLQETARSAVRDGIISGDGLTGARATVRRLRADEMLPPCPLPKPPPPPAPVSAPGTPGAPGNPGAQPGQPGPQAQAAPARPGGPGRPGAQPGAPGRPGGQPAAHPQPGPPPAGQPAPGLPASGPDSDLTAPAPDTTPLPEVHLEPGKTCRLVS